MTATAICLAGVPTRAIDNNHRIPGRDGRAFGEPGENFHTDCAFCVRNDLHVQIAKASIVRQIIDDVCTSIDTIVWCAWAALASRDAAAPAINGDRPPAVDLQTVFRCTAEHNRHPAVQRAIMIRNSMTVGHGILAGLREATLRDGGPMYRKGGLDEYGKWQDRHLKLLAANPADMPDFDKVPKISALSAPLMVPAGFK